MPTDIKSVTHYTPSSAEGANYDRSETYPFVGQVLGLVGAVFVKVRQCMGFRSTTALHGGEGYSAKLNAYRQHPL